MPKYSEAPEVKKIADLLIRQHHDLGTVKIIYVFRDDLPMSKGREVWGKARKVSGLNAALRNIVAKDDPEQEFFVIEIAKPKWDVLSAKQRTALVDHELSHLFVDEEGKLAVVGHDVEEFTVIVKRHGLWKDDVRRFVETGAEQLKLDYADDKKSSRKPVTHHKEATV